MTCTSQQLYYTYGRAFDRVYPRKHDCQMSKFGHGHVRVVERSFEVRQIQMIITNPKSVLRYNISRESTPSIKKIENPASVLVFGYVFT